MYIYTTVRYMGGFLTPRVAEYGMYGHGCMGVGWAVYLLTWMYGYGLYSRA